MRVDRNKASGGGQVFYRQRRRAHCPAGAMVTARRLRRSHAENAI